MLVRILNGSTRYFMILCFMTNSPFEGFMVPTSYAFAFLVYGIICITLLARLYRVETRYAGDPKVDVSILPLTFQS